MKTRLETLLSPFVLIAMLVGCAPSTPNHPSDGDGGVPNPNDCQPGYGRCNGVCVDLSTNDNCGHCGNVCAAGNTSAFGCANGFCTEACLPGFGNCNGQGSDGCESALNTETNCQSCGLSCSAINASGSCDTGTCSLSCSSGFGDCNMDYSDGCESDFGTPQACGGCANGCAGACMSGHCQTCDSAVALDSNDPLDAAKAIGLCADVVSARWALPDGSNAPTTAKFKLGHGLLSGFGPNMHPREGNRMLALSSGTARQPNDLGSQPAATPSAFVGEIGGFEKDYPSSMPPAGFPKPSPACPFVVTGAPNDAIALEVTLKVPDWANGFSFDFDFYTYEWPNYMCSTFNDLFVAILDPIPAGQTDGNISFDAMGNVISVNNAFVSVCGCALGPPCMAGGRTFACSQGDSELVGTPFKDQYRDHAATSWLTTKAPVAPGSTIKLRFAIYDAGDHQLDSTTLIDNFRWLPAPPEVGTEPIP